jgi:hypothetical protein
MRRRLLLSFPKLKWPRFITSSPCNQPPLKLHTPPFWSPLDCSPPTAQLYIRRAWPRPPIHAIVPASVLAPPRPKRCRDELLSPPRLERAAQPNRAASPPVITVVSFIGLSLIAQPRWENAHWWELAREHWWARRPHDSRSMVDRGLKSRRWSTAPVHSVYRVFLLKNILVSY